MDLVFYGLTFEQDFSFLRVSPSYPIEKQLLSDTDKRRITTIESKQIVGVPNEWQILSKARDLVCHGYYTEGLIIGFALLDYLTQDFVKNKITHLNKKERDGLMRRIESQRLVTFLGPMLKMLQGFSPLDDLEMSKNLEWINKKRNDVMHDGDTCSTEDAQRSLLIIFKFLKYFNEHGATYVLPSELIFW